MFRQSFHYETDSEGNEKPLAMGIASHAAEDLVGNWTDSLTMTSVVHLIKHCGVIREPFTIAPRLANHSHSITGKISMHVHEKNLPFSLEMSGGKSCSRRSPFRLFNSASTALFIDLWRTPIELDISSRFIGSQLPLWKILHVDLRG